MVRQNGNDPLLLKVELNKTSFVTGNRAYDLRYLYVKSMTKNKFYAKAENPN